MNPEDLHNAMQQLGVGQVDFNTTTKEEPEEYLQKYLIELQQTLDEEIDNRRSLEDIFTMLGCYVGNYTLSFTLISLGFEIVTSSLLSASLGIIPTAMLISKSGLKTRKTPLITRVLLGFITNFLAFSTVSLPHLQSAMTVKEVYQHVNTLEYGKPEENLLTNLQNSPVLPVAGGFILLGVYLATKKEN